LLQFVNLEKNHDVKTKALRGRVTNAKSSGHAMQSRANPNKTKAGARLRRVPIDIPVFRTLGI
jgi:hypothetical protein